MKSGFNFGLFPRRQGGNNVIVASTINLGSTKGRGSATRMFNYCNQHSANPSECINQFINVMTAPIPAPAPIPSECDYTFTGTGPLTQTIVNTEIGTAQKICIVGYTSIDSNAFLFKNQITSVTIGTSVTSIGVQAFRATGLTSITIPDSVTSIGNYAFYNCSALTSVVIPSIVTSIGDGVFAYCSALTSVVIPSIVTSIGDEAFYNCFSLTSVTIGSSVTSIGVEAFRAAGLTSIVIPASVTTISNIAFTGSALSTVYIADGQIISGITFTSPDTGVSFFGVTVATELPP